ncbi:hypothetical protein Areg01_82850 [Actinoplanes regularis]|nr:hypothetical protein Areg01_82850 [Actinoplanes regularis]
MSRGHPGRPRLPNEDAGVPRRVTAGTFLEVLAHVRRLDNNSFLTGWAVISKPPRNSERPDTETLGFKIHQRQTTVQPPRRKNLE